MSTQETHTQISQSLGCLSIGIWLFAQVPQAYKNYRRKSIDGISSGFLAIWLIGDLSNLSGSLLTGQLLFQIVLAAYYVVMDLVLWGQFYMFRSVESTSLLIGVDPDDFCVDNLNNRRDSTGKGFRRRLSSLIAVSTASVGFGRASAIPIFEQNGLAPSSRETSSISGLESYRSLGFALSYFSSVMYVSSRVPQILHNYQRKSTAGVTPLLFSATLAGNLTYALSIFTSSSANGPEGRAFLLKELPFLVGTMGTMLFDVILLGQHAYYKRTESKAVAHPIAPDMLRDTRRLRAYVDRPIDKSSLLLSHQSIYSAVGSETSTSSSHS